MLRGKTCLILKPKPSLTCVSCLPHFGHSNSYKASCLQSWSDETSSELFIVSVCAKPTRKKGLDPDADATGRAGTVQ